MDGRDLAPAARLLSERGAAVHRAASRITPAGHSSVQHPGHFQPGKYYPSPIPMAPHTGSGLMGNSSASFMGSFLTNSLGSPPSHGAGPPSSPSSPSFRGGPHSTASQIWFPHSHEAPGYPRFSGSLPSPFIPMSHLDHHSNGGMLYGQHCFYDTQKDNFYLRGLPSQPHLLPTNHSFPAISRAAPGHPHSSCSRERDSGGGAHKSLKDVVAERGVVSMTKDKERSGSKHEAAKERLHPPPSPHQHQHHQPHGLQHSMEQESSGSYGEDPVAPTKLLSACILDTNGDVRPSVKNALSSCGGIGSGSRHPAPNGAIRCSKEGVSGEMRICEHPTEYINRGQMLHHAVPYSMPPPPNPGGFHCLPLHPSHPHHHPHHHHHDFYCPPPPAPLIAPPTPDKGRHGDPKVTGPTFVPSVGQQAENGPSRALHLSNPDCRALGGGTGSSKDKSGEKGGLSGGSGATGSCQRKQNNAYGKADKDPDWLSSHQHQLIGPHLPGVGCLSTLDTDIYRPSLPQGAKGGPPAKDNPYIRASPYRDCSHPGPPQDGKSKGGTGCSIHRDSQKVAPIRHQQHSRSGPDPVPTEPCQSDSERKLKLQVESAGYGEGRQQPLHTPAPLAPWPVRTHRMTAEEEQRHAFLDPFGCGAGRQPEQQPEDGGAMKGLLKYGGQQPPPLLLSQKSPFGGLAYVEPSSGGIGNGCIAQEGKQTLPQRKGAPGNGEKHDPAAGRGGREASDGLPPHGEGEVRQPPVGIAVAVARQRDPPSCRPLDTRPGHSRQGRVMPTAKGVPRPMFPLNRDSEEERKRMCEEQHSLACLDRDRELFIRDAKERVEFPRMHPSSSCHGDLTSHLMVPGGTSLPASQLGTDPSLPAHHHWMPRTGSPSLWMSGHSYGISHAALHQNLPPGFSAAMPSPLQPVLPLPQDPSAQLVVLPSEPAAHPAAHHLDVMEQPGLWPPVYPGRGHASHMQHPAMYSRSQFLRQQELYALQHHQHHHHHEQHQQPHRAVQVMELQQRNCHSLPQRKSDEAHVELDSLPSQPRPPKPTKPFSVAQLGKNTPPSGPCTAHPSPCCRSPSTLRPHPNSTPCPTPSPAAAAPRSPALSPAPPRPAKGTDSQKGQPPQDYTPALEPDLPPDYTYPDIGYRSGPSPQHVRLAEPADLEAVPAEPAAEPLTFCDQGKEPERNEAGLLRRTSAEALEEEPKGAEPQGVRTENGYAEPEQMQALFSCVPTEIAPDAQPEAPTPERAGEEEEGTACEEETRCANLNQEDSAVSCLLGDAGEEESNRSRTEEGVVCSPSPYRTDSSCIWSLELLIAAALCGDPGPAPAAPAPSSSAPACAGYNGMELLSELASLELSTRNSQEQEELTFDLRSLATVAAARALELNAAGAGPGGANRKPEPIRRTLNLRRKWSWTPRHRPVCPAKVAMETLDGQELAMRVQLAELQRCYKEKQRELARLQRKHDHQKEERPRSPARRGPGRPRKRKSTPCSRLSAPAEASKRVSPVETGLGLLGEDVKGGGETLRKRKKLANHKYLGSPEMKKQHRRLNGRQGVMDTKFMGKPMQLKHKAKAKISGSDSCDREPLVSGAAPLRLSREKTVEHKGASDSGGQSDTGSGDGGTLVIQKGVAAHGRKGDHLQVQTGLLRARNGYLEKRDGTEEKDTSPNDSESSDEEEEDEGSYHSEEGRNDTKAHSPKDPSSGSSLISPSPSSVVKLEANQKAKIKKERQGLTGCINLCGVEGKVKVRKRALGRPSLLPAEKRRLWVQEKETGRRAPALKRQCWRSGATGGNVHQATSEERLKKATRKSYALKSAMRTPKGRAISRLLESFTTDEGFHMDEQSSFSDADEDVSSPESEPLSHRASPTVTPNCILTKEVLVDGLKVLISKEDELLYTAHVYTLDLPDIYRVVIDGERGNRPRIYSLEQVLQEAVLDVRPESDGKLSPGTRVCAYWSERSRCLYPGYVCKGSPGEEEKQGSVMVEFDDGDKGWISLANVRFLPPDYQIHCAEPSPALLVTRSRRGRRSSTQEKNVAESTSSERPDNMDVPGGQEKINISKGKTKSISLGTKTFHPMSESLSKTKSPFSSWPTVAASQKRAPNNYFQFNGTPRKIIKGKEPGMFPLFAPSTIAPYRGIFSSTFEVDSFSSIANGYSSFYSQTATVPLGSRGNSCGKGRKAGEAGIFRSKKASAEFLVKLDHEGVTSPKTKSSKSRLLLGTPCQGIRMDKGYGSRGIECMSSTMEYSHPVLLVKDNKKRPCPRTEFMLKGTSHMRKSSSAPTIQKYPDFGMNCHNNYHNFYSDVDEEEDEEDRSATMAASSDNLRVTGHFLSRLSVSSSSSGSSSSSSSSSLSSSSICSSDNDSSYSSEDEESSTLLLQGCLSSHHTLLQSMEPPSGSPPHNFVAKAMAVTNAKGIGPGNNSTSRKLLKKKECPNSSSSSTSTKGHKDPTRRQKLSSSDTLPKTTPFAPVRQLWKWSGNPTQRRGMKGKARKLFYKAIVRDKDMVHVGDCAVFLSSGRPNLPYIGRIESFWESWSGNMVVKVKWFYHPEETRLGKRHKDGKHALYQSSHEDENDVQTISHICQVVSREEYEQLSRSRKHSEASQDLYYLAGSYDPTSGQLVTADGVAIFC